MQDIMKGQLSLLSSARAVLAAAVFLIGFLSSPVSLAFETGDVCSMTCCVEKGRCCCAQRHSSVAGEAKHQGPLLNEPRIVAACPEDCATATGSGTSFSRVSLRAAALHLESGNRPAVDWTGRIVEYRSIGNERSNPRAPPSRLEA
jgi:hypothetical protein